MEDMEGEGKVEDKLGALDEDEEEINSERNVLKGAKV